MQDTHNELSPEELKVISNADFFKLKNEITHKIEAHLALLGEHISELLKAHSTYLPPDVLKIAPKISRGEQYMNLPWLILDYPRIFSGKDTYAFRSMFWWGNYFSFTVHIAGKYMHTLKRQLIDNISELKGKDFYIYINQDQWQHHYGEANYRLLDTLSKKEIESALTSDSFIKIGRTLPLFSFSKMIPFGEDTYKEFLKVVY